MSSSILPLLSRNRGLFDEEISLYDQQMRDLIMESSFLVIGGAGSIGQAVVHEIFKRNPRKLHVVDISENNMVELVRDVRTSLGYIDGDFRTFILDAGSTEYDAFIKADGKYDYVLNLSALKHVRSEKDPFTLMRLIQVNILNTEKTMAQALTNGSRRYFCVSTDKAAAPVNMMGASKRIMEHFLIRRSFELPVSTARFANVAFSDGSLLQGFKFRLEKGQPLAAPNDIKRYFITPQESGELCMMSCLFGENRDIFFPKLSQDFRLIGFDEIATKFLNQRGYEPQLCASEEEARALADSLPAKGKWPCYFSASDTTGEKDYEEFYTDSETLDMERYPDIGVIKHSSGYDNEALDEFLSFVEEKRRNGEWTKKEIVTLFGRILPDFKHVDTGRYLDSKM
ncbi:MAG: UDP-N-acetylglucosamine 4,6-dehydratase [Leptospiraceae bacterium]